MLAGGMCMDNGFMSWFGLFILLNFASEKKQIRYLWSYVDGLGGVFFHLLQWRIGLVL